MNALKKLLFIQLFLLTVLFTANILISLEKKSDSRLLASSEISEENISINPDL